MTGWKGTEFPRSEQEVTTPELFPTDVIPLNSRTDYLQL